MHPYLSGLMAEAHREDMLRDGDQRRLAAEALVARRARPQVPWRTAVAQLSAKARLIAKPAPATAMRCARQPVCCPA